MSKDSPRSDGPEKSPSSILKEQRCSGNSEGLQSSRETTKEVRIAEHTHEGSSAPMRIRGKLAQNVEIGRQDSYGESGTGSMTSSDSEKAPGRKSDRKRTLGDRITRGIKSIYQGSKRPNMLSRGMTKLPRDTWIQQTVVNSFSISKRISLKIVNSSSFESVMGGLVFLNCVLLGVQSEIFSGNSSCTLKELQLGLGDCRSEAVFYYLDYIFLLIFTVELVLKILALGVRETLGNMGGAFDAMIVAVGWITEIIVPLILIAATPDLKALQTLKMLRVLRAVRVLRMAKMFNDLWFVVQSFFRCLRPLLWVVSFIFVILFLFSILAINFVGQNSDFDGVVYDNGSTVQDRWASTFSAMMTLFQIATLDEWYAILAPLFERGSWTYVFFITYIAIAALALMNLVTAVVVDTSVKRTQEESRAQWQKQIFEQRVNSLVTDLQDLFESCDTDGSGMMELEEFIGSCEMPILKKLCTMIGLEGRNDMEELFRLMSGDEDQLHMEDFVDSVTKISQAANDRIAVAVIRTARSRSERLYQVKKIVERQPEISTRLNDVQDHCVNVGLRMTHLQRDLATFKKKFEGRIKNISREFALLSSASDELDRDSPEKLLHKALVSQGKSSVRYSNVGMTLPTTISEDEVSVDHQPSVDLEDLRGRRAMRQSEQYSSKNLRHEARTASTNVKVVKAPIFGQRVSQGLDSFSHSTHSTPSSHSTHPNPDGLQHGTRKAHHEGDRHVEKPITPGNEPYYDQTSRSKPQRQRSHSLDRGFRFRASK